MCRHLVLAFLVIELAVWLTDADALPACPGQRFYIKAGESLAIEFNRTTDCYVRFMTVERGTVERRLFYKSGTFDFRSVTAGQNDIPDAWSELPQRVFLRASNESVVRFLAEPPIQANTAQQFRSRPGDTLTRINLQNATNETITHYWIDSTGSEINYGNIAPRSSVTLNTFDRHVWRIKRTSTNEIISQFAVSQRTQVITINTLTSLRDQEKKLARQTRPQPQAKSAPARPTVQAQRGAQTFAPTNQPSGGTTMGFLDNLWSLIVTLFWLGLIGGTIYAVVKTIKSMPSVIFSHWYTLIENLQCSSISFYQSVESTIENRKVPQSNLSRVTWPEGGVFSARREYLRVKRKDLILDICAAPFGTGFFISWWLGPKPGLLGFFYSIPVFGVIFGYLTRPFTYYRIDTALMFQEAVNDSVQEVIEGLTKAQGLRSLSENERKPILRNFFQR
jgi:hypothetical protein